MYQIGAAREAYAWLGSRLAHRASEILGLEVEYADTQLPDDPDLVLTQVCGFPFQHQLRGPWVVLATPSFRQLADVPPGHYRSVLIAGRDDVRTLDELRCGVVAVSESMSQSGHHALLQHLSRSGLMPQKPAQVLATGAHARSVRAVAEGEAQLAAIDAVTFHLLSQAEPKICQRVRVLDKTEAAPGLPIIVRREFASRRAKLLEALEYLLRLPEASIVGWQQWTTDLDYAELTRRRDDAAARGWGSLIDS